MSPAPAPATVAAPVRTGWRLPTIKELAYLTALTYPPFNPPGYDPKVVKPWSPNFEQYVKLRDQWVEEWNKVYGYRQ